MVEAGQDDGRLSRRTFVRVTGAAGAAMLLPGWLAACGSDDDGGGSASSGGGGGGPDLKIGYVTPGTGALAAFAEADSFILDGIRDRFSGGIDTKKGKSKVTIIVKDSQSDPNRAGAVASDLILKDGVDLVVVASTPETTNPVSDQCELNGVPCISSVAPWQSWFFGRKGDPAKPFKSTYHFFWGVEDLTAVYIDLWDQLDTNKKAGGLWPNDSDGKALSDPKTGFPAAMKKAGYTVVDPGRYENLTNDYSAQISRFKSADCDILTGVPLPPDFTKFYKQAAQQGYQPKAATIAKAILFPAAVEALGPLAEGLTSEVWWTPTHPFKSSITGQTAQQLADAYSESSNKQWTQPIGYVHALFEVSKDVLGRASDPKDKGAVAEAIKATSLDTIVGPLSWSNGPVPNVAKTPLVGGQWTKGTDFPWDLVVVRNTLAEQIPTAGKVKAIAA
jgi:branched-chain amino acid transport system substrate-binding protein